MVIPISLNFIIILNEEMNADPIFQDRITQPLELFK